MARRGKKDDLKIEYVFPGDYKVIDSLLDIKSESIVFKTDAADEKENLKDQITRSPDRNGIRIHPEYELLFKLENKRLAKKNVTCINQLQRKKRLGVSSSHAYFQWSDFFLQFPGIYEMFGIERKYTLNGFETVIQIPKYFILLLNARMQNIKPGYRSTCLQIWDLAGQTIKNYKSNEENHFDQEEMEVCYGFLCNDTECRYFGGCLAEIEHEKIEAEKAEHTLQRCGIKETITIPHEKGHSISFPDHLASIISAFHKYFSSWIYSIYNIGDDQEFNLWGEFTESVIDKDQDKEVEKVEEAYYTIINYMYYRHRVKNFDVSYLYIFCIAEMIQEWAVQYKKLYHDFQQCFVKIIGELQKEEDKDDIPLDLVWAIVMRPYSSLQMKCKQPLKDLKEFMEQICMFFKSVRTNEKREFLIEEIREILEGEIYVNEIKTELEEIKCGLEQEQSMPSDDPYMKLIFERADSICSFFIENQRERNVDELIDGCKDIISNPIVCEEKYLINYYTSCLAALENVSFEKNYKKVAWYNFERLFSLYLFKQETDYVYDQICNAAKDLTKGRETDQDGRADLKMQLAEIVMQKFDAEIWNRLYCSPGIFHRVSLAEYIIKKAVDPGELEAEYKDDSANDWLYRIDSCQLISDIEDVNKIYYQEEEEIIYSSRKEKNIQVNEQKFWSEELEAKYETYKGFYAKIRKLMADADKISERRKDIKDGMNKSSIQKAAKDYLTKDEFGCNLYRHIHFWVIFSSLAFKNGIISCEIPEKSKIKS